jgi:PAS domain S-box-containing protein
MKTIKRKTRPLTEARPASRAGKPVKSSRGSPDAASLNAQLARENKRLAQENERLARERDLLRTIIDDLPDFIYAKDKQSRFLVNNLAHTRVLGATRPDEVAGKTDLDIFPAKLAKQYYADEQALIKSGQTLNREETVVDPKTGETRWLQTTKTPLRDKQGKVIGLVGISRDVTKRKLAEEAQNQAQRLLQALMDNIPDWIYFKDTQSRFLKCSKTHAQRLRADPEQVVGKTDFDFHPAEIAKEFHRDEQRIIKTGEPLINKVEKKLKPNGEVMWTSTTKVPMRDENGAIVGIVGVNRDITNQIQAEESQARSNYQLRSVLDNIPDRIYFKDTESRFVQCNRAVARRLGVKTWEQVIGKTDFDFYPREKAEEFHRDEQKIIKSGQPLLDKIEQVTMPDGKITWSSITKVPLRDEGGKVIGLVGISRNITELKQTEESLNGERRLLRTLIDNLPDGVYTKDTAGRKTLVNPADLKNLGCKTEAEAIGKNDFDLFPKDIAEKFWADDQKVLQGQPVINREEYFLDEAGQKCWLLTTKVPLRDKDGKVMGLVGVGRNITEQKRTEESLKRERYLLRALIDNLPDLVFIKDPQSRFVVTNMACARQLGASRPEEVLGKSDADFVKPELASQYLADEQSLMRLGQPVNQEEPTQHKGTGEMRWSMTTKIPLKDDAGNVAGLIGIARDITKQKRAEEALLHSRDELAHERRVLRTLIDNLPDGIYAKDTAGRKTLANPADLKVMKCRTEAEALGKTDFDFFPRDIAEKFQADDQKVFQGQPVIDREEYSPDEAGQKHWMLTSKLPLRDEQGKVVGLVGIGRDITKQKQAEQTLLQSRDDLEIRVAERAAELSQERRLLRTLIDNLPDSIYAKDAAGRKILANKANLKNIRCKTEAEAIGKTDFDFFPKDIAEKFWADDQKVIGGEPVINREEYFLNEEGQKRWSLTSKLPLRDLNGKIIGLVGIGRNITQTKQVEESLAYEQDLFHALLDSVPDNIYFKDRASRLVRASKSKVEATFQASCESYRATHPAAGPGDWPAHLASVEAFGKWLIGKTDFDTYPEAHARAAHEDEQEIIRTGRPIEGKLQKTTLADGKNIWWLSTKMPWRSREGNIVGTFGVSKDVTAIKETEETLIRQRVLLRTLIDNLPDAIYAKDAAGRKTLVNPADLKNLGYKTEAEAIGKSDFDFFPKDNAEKFWADDQKVLAGQPVIDREEFFLSKEGKKRWLLTSKLPLRDESGKIVGLVGLGRDITFRKQAEEALTRERLLLRTLIDSLPDLVFVKDSQGRFTVTNTACARQLGVSRPEKVLGKSDADFVAPELAAQYRADEEALMRAGQPVTKEERTQHKTLGMRWSLTTKVPLKDEAGNVAGLVGIARDITELKMAQETLRASEEKLRQFTVQLERSNHELQDFAYVASHDLQEPLRKIVVFSERLREKANEALEPESRDYLDRMQKAATRMQNLINGLLTFSRVTTKAKPFEPVDLAKVAGEVVADLEGRIDLVKGRVEVGPLPVIDAEALQMRQLLQNLIGNALKFHPPEVGPVVKVAAEIVSGHAPQADPTAPDEKLCRLTVSDNGIGFDEKYLDRIFNVFQRLHTRGEYEGTGMGLAITRKIALFHGGEITAKSKPGEGATFIVTLPVAHAKENTTKNEQASL